MGTATMGTTATDRSMDGAARPRAGAAHKSDWWYLLLLIPIAGLIYPGFYSRIEPTVAGVPFFLWYQFAWVFGSVAVTVIASRLTD